MWNQNNICVQNQWQFTDYIDLYLCKISLFGENWWTLYRISLYIFATSYESVFAFTITHLLKSKYIIELDTNFEDTL